MQNLIALKPFRIGGKWVATGDPVPVVEGFDYEKAARKGFLEDEDSDEVLNPSRLPALLPVQLATTEVAHDSAKATQDALELKNVRSELGQARQELSALQNTSEQLAQAYSELLAKRDAAVIDLADANRQVETLRGELVEAKKAALPTDALARINAVKGVGDTLAALVLAALTAPAAPPEPEPAKDGGP